MNVTVTLPEDLGDYLEAKLSEGVYTSSSELLGDALRLMRRVENGDAEELAFLRSAYRIGLEGGDPQDADFTALKAEGRRKLASLKS